MRYDVTAVAVALVVAFGLSFVPLSAPMAPTLTRLAPASGSDAQVDPVNCTTREPVRKVIVALYAGIPMTFVIGAHEVVLGQWGLFAMRFAWYAVFCAGPYVFACAVERARCAARCQWRACRYCCSREALDDLRSVYQLSVLGILVAWWIMELIFIVTGALAPADGCGYD